MTRINVVEKVGELDDGTPVLLDDSMEPGVARLEVDGRVVKTFRIPEHVMRAECAHGLRPQDCDPCMAALGVKRG